MTKQLHLNLFIYPDGHHEAAWRHPDSETDRILDISYYQELAQRAEAAKFDAVFFADGPSLAENIQYAARFRLEPITVMTAIVAATERIGVIGTASTTYTEPYNLARQLAALDHLSKGRAGWNIVTTGAADAALNFGLDAHPLHRDRYARAEEYVDVVTKLWDSWEDDAVVADRESGVFADPDKIHRIDHVGEYFRVAGPLNAPRSPQGRPVYVQAGSSDDGRAFAARWAEAIFTAHQTLGSAQEAEELHQQLNDLTQPEYSLAQLNRLTGVDLSAYDLDGPFPREVIDVDEERSEGSRFQLVLDIVEREQPTLRQLCHRLAGARGHRVVTGTPDQVADTIQEWAENGAADGFNVMPPWLPGGIEVFIEEVVPILRRRGLFRTEYTRTTLRDHLGLARPASQYAPRPDSYEQKETA